MRTTQLSIIGAMICCTLAPNIAMADLATDKSVGQCVAYLTVTKKQNTAAQALSFADNTNRAIQFGKAWMSRVKTAPNQSSKQSLVTEADGNCREIGIRPADYSN